MTPMTYFRNYPEPFYPDWRQEPVPGWGARPVMAGPRMVGVGASIYDVGVTAVKPSPVMQVRTTQQSTMRVAEAEAAKKRLWIMAGIGAVALAGIGYFVYSQRS